MEPTPRPAVLTWFIVYCLLMALAYVFCIGIALWIFFVAPTLLEEDASMAMIMPWIFLVLGIVLLVASILPLFLRPKPWVWIYDLVLICLGLTSCLYLPFSIPLLIFWMKPATKRYFGINA
jgi:hypothetical protein